MSGHDTLRKIKECEFTQSCEEGRDPVAIVALQSAFDRAGTDLNVAEWHL